MNIQQFLKEKGGADLITVGPNASIAEAARILAARNKGLALVCEDDRELLGVVSVIDITRAVAEFEDRAAAMPVEAIMTKNCSCCQVTDGVNAALDMMTRRGIRHLPVLEGKKLKGLLNMRGLLQQRFEEAGMETEEMRNYIYGLGYR